MKAINEKIKNLVNDGLCVAFSGGVDSSLILKIACIEGEKLKKEVHAVTFVTKLHPQADLEIAKTIAKEVGARHHVIKIDELDNDKILHNPIDRCYHCKKFLFETLIKFTKTLGVKNIVDGTNFDDLSQYRPGIKALDELHIISPLVDCKVTKKEVREMAKSLNLSVSERPSTPCMATRLPYNTKIDFDILKKIETGENILKNMGFAVNRLRAHDNIARIEVKKEDFNLIIKKSDEITNALKKLGFEYITFDLEGFRSGSMDTHLK